MTFLPSSKCFSSRKPFTRARIVTSLSARVVPIGLTTSGRVIFRDSTTVTVGGGGTLAAGPLVAARDAQHDRGRQARAGRKQEKSRGESRYRVALWHHGGASSTNREESASAALEWTVAPRLIKR